MHEVGLCEGVVEAVERRARGRQVLAVKLRVGALQRVSEEAMRQGFELVAAGTVADGADLDIVIIPATAACSDCAWTGDTTEWIAVCARCGGGNVELRGGDELTLESLRYQAETAGLARGPEGAHG